MDPTATPLFFHANPFGVAIAALRTAGIGRPGRNGGVALTKFASKRYQGDDVSAIHYSMGALIMLSMINEYRGDIHLRASS